MKKVIKNLLFVLFGVLAISLIVFAQEEAEFGRTVPGTPKWQYKSAGNIIEPINNATPSTTDIYIANTATSTEFCLRGTDECISDWGSISGVTDWTVNANGQLTPSSTIDVLLPANSTTTASSYLGTGAGLNTVYIDDWSDIESILLSGFTEGSVLHVGSADDLVQDNANFYWDRTEQRLGIGNNSPQTTLEVNGTSTFDIIDSSSHRIINVANPEESGDAINKAYFDANASGGLSWQDAVLDIIDFSVDEPAGPTLGDRYISDATSTALITGQFMYNQFIYTWDTTDWATTTPTNQMALKNVTDGKFYTFSSDDWNWNDLGSAFDHQSLLNLQGGEVSYRGHVTFNQSQNMFVKGVDDTDDLNEGSTNLFYTDGRVDSRVQNQDYSVNGDWEFNQAISVANPTDDLHAVNLETMNLYLNGQAWQEPVLDKDLSTPPGSPTLGDRYIVAGSASGWYDVSWSNRQQLDLDNADVTSAMTDYPVLIKLTDSANSVFSTSQTNGNDILFTDDDGNKLKHELEEYDTTGKIMLAHVKVPYLNSTSTTNIYMYYGNGASGNQQEVADTWDDDYEMVYHFDDASGNADDSTGIYDGSNTSITYGATGQIGDAYEFNGSTSYSDTGYTTSLSASDFTIEGWLKADTTAEVYAIAQAHTAPGYSSDFIYYYNGASNLWWMRSVQLAQPAGFDGTNWNHIVMVWDESAQTYEGFVNGVSAGTSGTVSGYGGVNSVKIGSRGDATSSFWEGIIDEVKISNVVRSDDYISTTYNIQSDPANFVTFGSEESISASGDWAGHVNSIMEWDSVNWGHATPTAGWATIVLDEDLQYTFDGSNWVISSGAVSAHNDTTGKQGGLVGEYFHWPLAPYTEATDWITAVVLGSNGDMDLGVGDITTTGDIEATNIEAIGQVQANQVIADGTGSHPSIATGYVELYVLGGTTGRILPYTGSSYIDLAIGDWNGGDPNIMLKTGGKVGINEGSPEKKLHVNGDGYFKGEADTEQLTVRGHTTQLDNLFVVEQSDGTDLLTVDNSGNVVVAGYASSTTGLYTKGDGHIGGDLTIDGNTTTTGDIYSYGDITLNSMNGLDSTYNSVNDWFNSNTSAGRGTGGELTDNGSQTVAIAAGTGFLRTADDDISQVKFVDWNASTTGALATNEVRYYGVEYNAGSPQVVVYYDIDDFDLDTDFPLGSVVNQAGSLYFNNNPWWVTDGMTNTLEVFRSLEYIRRDAYVGGLIIGVTGTRNPTLTAGVLWSLNTEHDISAKDCSGADEFYGWWGDMTDGWSRGETASSTYNVTQYYDGSSDSLVDMNNNYYANYWVWVSLDDSNNGELQIIYPQNQYSNVATAEAESVPVFPTAWYEHGELLGRILFKEGTDTPISVDSVYDVIFTAAQAADYNNLANLPDLTVYGELAEAETVTGIWDFSAGLTSATTTIGTPDIYFDFETVEIADVFGLGAGRFPLITPYGTLGGSPFTAGLWADRFSVYDADDDDAASILFANIDFTTAGTFEANFAEERFEFDWDITPAEDDDDSYDLGASGLEWRDIWIDGIANLDETRAGNLHATTTDFDMLYVNGNAFITGDTSITGDATTTGNLSTNFETQIGDTARGIKFEELNAGALGIVPVINPYGSSGGAIEDGSFGLIGSLVVMENDDDDESEPSLIFVSRDVATTFNVAEISYATTSKQMSFSADSFYFDGDATVDGGLNVVETLYIPDGGNTLFGTTTQGAVWQTACDDDFQCLDNTSYVSGAFSANYRNQTYINGADHVGGGALLNRLYVTQNKDGDYTTTNLDNTADVTNSSNDILNGYFGLYGNANYGGTHGGTTQYNIYADNTARATSTYNIYAKTAAVTGTVTTTGMYIEASGATNNIAIETNGGDNIFRNDVYAPDAYSNDISAGTYRDLYIQDDGMIGYLSSSINAKEEVKDLTEEDTSWVYDLATKEFEYKEDKTNKKHLGLIAEEVINVKPELVSYKLIKTGENCEEYPITDNKTQKTRMEKRCTPIYEKTNELATVNYTDPTVITALIKEVQLLKERIEVLENAGVVDSKTISLNTNELKWYEKVWNTIKDFFSESALAYNK